MGNASARAGHRTVIDWDAVKAALSSAQNHGHSDEDLDRIFRQRAQALARASHGGQHRAAATHLKCRVGTLGLLVPLPSVLRILRPGWTAAVPGAPAAFGRIMHVDGRIVAIADMARLFGVDDAEPASGKLAVLLGDAEGRDRLALSVDAVADLVSVDESALSAVSSTAAQGHDFVVGLGPKLELVLDASRLIGGLRAQPGTRVAQGENS